MPDTWVCQSSGFKTALGLRVEDNSSFSYSKNDTAPVVDPTTPLKTSTFGRLMI